jgi:hypothetical protein
VRNFGNTFSQSEYSEPKVVYVYLYLNTYMFVSMSVCLSDISCQAVSVSGVGDCVQGR